MFYGSYKALGLLLKGWFFEAGEHFDGWRVSVCANTLYESKREF
jgi:hypothetical protein